MKSIPLIGYSDKISLRSEETISFKVSSTLKTPFTASLKRSISADPNPLGAGIIEEDASKYFKTRSFKSRTQDFNPGSYAISKKSIKINIKKELCINVIIFPTLSTDGKQTILSFDNLELYIDSNGKINLSIEKENISVDESLLLNSWYELKIKFLKNGKTTILQKPIKNEYQNKKIYKAKFNLKTILKGKLSLAALITKQQVTNHYNGKIEAPKIIVDGKKVFECDLSRNTSFSYVKSTIGPMLVLKNFPTRAVTSSKWDGSEMNWQHKPDHYSAIHFHNDDIYDFEWDTDFKFKIPNNMPSGVYVMKIKGEGYEDSMPFFVAPKIKKIKSKICVLISTFTYSIYGNHARVDYDESWLNRIKEWGAYPYNPVKFKEYGLSTYNYHSDGSGICHASHRRPLFNLRPGYLTFGGSKSPCSGLRHWQAERQLMSWLHNKNLD